MILTEIIIAVLLIAQFIYLLKRINKMAVIDDLQTAITELDASIESMIALLNNLRDQLGNSVLASDVEAEIAKLQAIKAKVDAAKQ